MSADQLSPDEKLIDDYLVKAGVLVSKHLSANRKSMTVSEVELFSSASESCEEVTRLLAGIADETSREIATRAVAETIFASGAVAEALFAMSAEEVVIVVDGPRRHLGDIAMHFIPNIARDLGRQAGQRKKRGSKKPKLDALIARELRHSPKAKAPQLWTAVPRSHEGGEDADLFRDGFGDDEVIVEIGGGQPIGRKAFAARVSMIRRALFSPVSK